MLGTESTILRVMWRDINADLQLVRLAWPHKIRTVQCLSWTFHSEEMEATSMAVAWIFRDFRIFVHEFTMNVLAQLVEAVRGKVRCWMRQGNTGISSQTFGGPV